MDIVGQHFRPEFINRVDDVVVFHPLGPDHIRGIAAIQLDELRQRLAERELELEVSNDAIDKLVEQGFDPVYGARPLKRAIQRLIENPLAEQILGGKFLPGDTIRIGLEGDRITFTCAGAQAA